MWDHLTAKSAYSQTSINSTTAKYKSPKKETKYKPTLKLAMMILNHRTAFFTMKNIIII